MEEFTSTIAFETVRRGAANFARDLASRTNRESLLESRGIVDGMINISDQNFY